MITEQALQEAIAECQGTRDPNRETCMMLAAFYTIQDHLYPTDHFPDSGKMVDPAYSFAAPPETMQITEGPETVGEYGESDFLRAVAGKDPAAMWKIMDDLMDTLKMVNERSYNSVMRKIR